jgi:hypothetical protein
MRSSEIRPKSVMWMRILINFAQQGTIQQSYYIPI